MPFGLDISDLSLEVLELKKRFGGIKFFSAGRLEIPAGIFDNGVVKKKRELAEAIKKACHEAKPHQIRGHKVVVSLPEAKIFSRIFKFPKKLNQKQIADILKFEVPNVLPIETDDVYSDFLVLRYDGGEQEVFYAACPKKIIDDLREVLRLAGLEAIVFEIETSSTARALTGGGKEGEGMAIVDIGSRRTVIAIFDKRGIRSSVTVKTAGNAFTEEIAKRLKVKNDTAEELKKSCGLSVEDKKCREGKVFFALQSLFPPIISEIKKSISYYEKQTGRKIERVFLCGGSRYMPGLADYLKANLGAEVRIGRPYLLDYSIGGGSRIKVLSSLMDVFGLAQRAAGKNPVFAGINLLLNLGGAAKRKKRFNGKRFFVDFIFLAAILGTGFWAFNNLGFFIGSQKSGNAVPAEIAAEKNITPAAGQISLSLGENSQGRIIEITRKGTKKFTATGEKLVDGKAEGKVTVLNKSSSSQSLVVNTRLISTGQILFRMKNGISVPAGGAAEVEVYADKEGPAGNIGPDSFYLPGLSSAFQKLIYAESKTAMTGGSVKKSLILAEDISRAKEQFLEELADEVLEMDLGGDLREGEIILPLILDSNIADFSVNPEEGVEALEFDLSLEVKVKILAIPEEFLKTEAARLIKSGGATAEPGFSLENLSFRLVDYNQDLGEVKVEIKRKD